MKQAFDRFILAIPVLFIKQFPYAWIAAVASWSWPPVLSAIFLVIVVIGLLMLRWQSKAWISNLRREHAFKDGRFYVDLPSFSGITAVKRILLLLAGAALIALLLKGSFGLTFWKIFVIVMGFTILYRDTQFFGAETTYVVTDQGIGIRFVPSHVDYRLFLLFKEISRIEKSQYQTDKNWDLFARSREPKDGLLMIPKNPSGFTRRIETLFIVPQDREKFLEQLPHGMAS